MKHEVIDILRSFDTFRYVWVDISGKQTYTYFTDYDKQLSTFSTGLLLCALGIYKKSLKRTKDGVILHVRTIFDVIRKKFADD